MSNLSRPNGLAYQSAGNGPLVILLHGLLMRGADWEQNGLVKALSKDYCVICPDLPAHGDSPLFTDPAAYSLENQSKKIIQLINESGYSQAHIIGYSAGAWLATGLLKHHPEQLSSLVIGGWDIVNGVPDGPDGRLDFATFMAYARSTAPELTAGMTAEREVALGHFFREFSQKASMASVVKHAAMPVLFWAGNQDIYYQAVETWSNAHDFPLITGAGDHMTMYQHPGPQITAAIYRFINSVS